MAVQVFLSMLVAVLHNAVADEAPADERDVLVQVEAVSGGLRMLGHDSAAVPVTLDLGEFASQITELRPAVAFNLVEALGGTDRLSAAVPILLETLGVPYTGNDADALHVTNSKRLTKGRLGSITPEAFFPDRAGGLVELAGGSRASFPARYLVKAVHEHASFGMDDGAVVTADSEQNLADAIRERSDRYGKPFFAERFIDGLSSI